MSARTVGVEEELLLFDRGTGHLSKSGDELADDQQPGSGPAGQDPPELPSVEHEFKRQQIETATSPQADLAELLPEISRGRAEVARRGLALGAAPAALATDPGPGSPATTDDSRYHRMMKTFGSIAAGQLTCGMHVHVSIESRDEGVAVLDRIRTWLPLLLAMSANSPYTGGADTSYASYRNISWSLWPTAGPTEVFGTPSAYDRAVEQLVATGAAIDPGMIYFDARLAVSYPTVEIRVMDVVPTAEEAVVLAALCRALVATAATDWRAGRPPPAVPRSVVRAATWRAARYGLTDQLVEPRTGRLAPAAAVLAGLVDQVAVSLQSTGDSDLVRSGVQRLLSTGTGSERQRAVVARGGSVDDVVAAALQWTTGRTG